MTSLEQSKLTSSFTNSMMEGTAFTFLSPEPVPGPVRLLGWSEELAQQLQLNRPEAGSTDLEILAGNKVTPNMKPFAVRYGGHQFGRWAGQLGDGRAIILGELHDLHNQPWELQLKGAGRTPYSRRGDGRAVLRSSLREFVVSEAMHYLRVPTTRSLSLVATGAQVERDMFYDGHPRLEPSAIASRLAPTFVRFGNFEIHASRDEQEALKNLANWTIQNHFKNIDLTRGVDAYGEWFREVCVRTARLMVEWLRVGFVHGVMNTDNMSILGWTIDYGPFGFLDAYEPDWTPNTTDLPSRRYCYGRQASIALWNCERLGDALMALIPKSLIDEGLKAYVTTYESSFLDMMAGKLGLRGLSGDDDLKLLVDLDQLLQIQEIDMTLFFRGLSKKSSNSLLEALYSAPTTDFQQALSAWQNHLEGRVRKDEMDPEVRKAQMELHNPWLVPRNYLLYRTIEAVEEGDLKALERLFSALKTPYTEKPEFADFAVRRPDWAKTQPGSSTLSCSS